MKWLLVLGLAGLGACGSSQAPAGTGATPPPVKAEMDACSSDADCTLVEACCGCTAGGRRLAIRADAVASYDASRPQRCGGEMCSQVMSTHASCDAEATCGQNGHCRVAPHMKHE